MTANVAWESRQRSWIDNTDAGHTVIDPAAVSTTMRSRFDSHQSSSTSIVCQASLMTWPSTSVSASRAPFRTLQIQ